MCHLVAGSHAAHRQTFTAFLKLLLGEKFSLARSINPARMKYVDANPRSDKFNRGRSLHVVICSFGHVVRHCRWKRDDRMR